MRPYYSESGITIYHGDCREILPGLEKVDLMLTDPPYGIGADSTMAKQAGQQQGRAAARKRDYGETAWDSIVDLSLILDCVAAGKHAAVFGGNYYAMPPSSAWLVWDKENGSTRFADCELAWTNYGIAVRMVRHMWNGMLRKGGENRDHPTQKPLHVMTWALGLCPGKPQTVLDPFMGSGTTLRAAKDMGLTATGIEREEKYCELAANRLQQEVLF